MIKKLVGLLVKLVGLELAEPKVVKTVEPIIEHVPVVLSEEDIRKEVDTILSDIQDEGYTEIPNILAQHPIEVVVSFVRMQEIATNLYDNELSDTDTLGVTELIDKAVELNQIQYQQRMRDMGMSQITEGQVRLIKRLLQETGETAAIPTDKFQASDMIERLNKKLGRKPRTANSKPTTPQMRRLNWLATEVNVPVPTVTTIKGASDQIEALQAMYDTKLANGEVAAKMATEPQLAYMQRLYKMNGKRWIKTSANKFAKMTAQEMSKEIESMKELVAKNNPNIDNISEGQVSYIISLCGQLNLPYNVDDIKGLTKTQATNRIDKLRRELIIVLGTVNGTRTIQKSDVDLMSNDQVTAMLKQMQLERRTTEYTETVQTVGDRFADMPF